MAVALLLLPAAAFGTHLSPFIDLQEKGLTLSGDAAGLVGLGGGSVDLTVTVGGNVRFALLYWAGRQRPCDESGPGTCVALPTPPYRDQEMVFDGTAITGTIIGDELQPVSGGGPIYNIGYFADVTSLVLAKGPGTHTFTLADGNPASNLWRADGAALLVGWIDAGNPNWYRVIIHDGLDFAFGPDPTPGETRVTAPATINHGANAAPRVAELWLGAGDGTPGRPDNIQISNNATLFNSLDASAGDQFDLEQLTIDIPAGVGSTSVQYFSAPVNENPDSMLWEVAALRVRQLDITRARCPVTLLDPGPPARVEVTVQDTGSGLAEILVTRSENADTVVPPFTVGTTDPVVVTATKIDQTKKARIEMRVTDLAGNVALCDPIHHLAVRTPGRPVSETLTNIPGQEDEIIVTNGSPGLKNLRISVNGYQFQVAGLYDGEERVIDISAWMIPGDVNTIVVTALGGPGDADLWIWEGSD